MTELKLSLTPKFNGRVQRGPDMWILRDCPLGANMITLGVPHGDKTTAMDIAHCVNAYPVLVEALKRISEGGPIERPIRSYALTEAEAYDRELDILHYELANRAREALAKAGVK